LSSHPIVGRQAAKRAIDVRHNAAFALRIGWVIIDRVERGAIQLGRVCDAANILGCRGGQSIGEVPQRPERAHGPSIVITTGAQVIRS
jgi:hypothetical protein